ncbi:rho crystallin-like isoform X2 [Pseudophryne corroboree]|uniref:rho crystallin-like isoform X2 n=1 Tax=Pseudophryne corroboree TaxID=495146 RepID=UPI003081BD9D
MALTKDTRVTLNDGNTMPVLGLGTYAAPDVPKSVGEEATKIAIDIGYRHIDCAYVYRNEVQIGNAIRAKIDDGTVRREDIFYTGKLWCMFFSPELVRKGLEKSLSDLQLEYLDLFIMHWPFSIKPTGGEVPSSPEPFQYDDVDFCSTWEALEACKDAGLVKSIGVSNFNRRQLERLLNKPGLKYKPVCNQVAKILAGEAVKVALEVGYRHIDCAFLYGNEVEVGRAIKEKIADGTVKREDVFYTGKLWSNSHTPDRVRPALEKSLKDLQLDYMDLFLIHTPLEVKPGDDLYPVDENGKCIYHNTDLRDTWKAMEECKDAGLVKSIGVSNFNKRQVELILHNPTLKYKPVECHIYINQSKLLAFLKSHDIALVAYCVLGSSRDEQWIDQSAPVLLEDPVLVAVAEKRGRTPAQVAMRYLLQRGIMVLAKSYTPARIRQNLQVFDFQLSNEEMKTLEDLNRNMRYTDGWQDHPKYPFGDEY